MTEPLTNQQLRAIGSGQTIVSYRGDFTADIARCAPRGPDDPGAPLYAAV